MSYAVKSRLRCLALLGVAWGLGLGAGGVRADDGAAAQLSCPVHQPLTQALDAFASAQDKDAEALLYLWSPRMVLSVQHAHQVRLVARARGLLWLPMLDPRVPQAEAETALQTLAPWQAAALRPVQPLCDHDLLQAGQTLRHFPTAWVWQRPAASNLWQQQGLPIVSAMPAQFWDQAIVQRLSAKKRQAAIMDLPAALKSRAIQ